MTPGEIFRHEAFYADEGTGELRRKYFVVLGILNGGDIVIRLLTSRAHGRPEDPKCFHGHPYPSYFLGVPGGELGTKTWVDLRYLDDVDALDVQREIQRNIVKASGVLDRLALMPLLDCAAAAEDTTQRQERAMRDLLAAMR
jgi:hypothetical protein